MLWEHGGREARGLGVLRRVARLTSGTPILLQASRKFSTFLRHLAMLSLGWKKKTKHTTQKDLDLSELIIYMLEDKIVFHNQGQIIEETV